VLTAVGAGAFGGTRFGVERALGTERFLDQVGDISSRLRQAGFESGAARFAADRASQLQCCASTTWQELTGADTRTIDTTVQSIKRYRTSWTCRGI
jgi:hypothetical protein